MIELVRGLSGAAVQSGILPSATPIKAGVLEAAKNFAGELARSIQAGESAAVGGVTGTVPMNEVIQKVMEAERSVTTLISVRDKAVASILELTRMQI